MIHLIIDLEFRFLSYISHKKHTELNTLTHFILTLPNSGIFIEWLDKAIIWRRRSAGGINFLTT